MRAPRLPAPETITSTLWTGSIAVPSDFFGMTVSNVPYLSGTPVTPPTYRHAVVRSHDVGDTQWRHINTSNGVYNWSRMDQWCDYWYSRGKAMIYTVYGTPTWASSDIVTPDAYGYLGGKAPPTSMASLSTFITALVSRYVARGTPFSAIESWNEPQFPGQFFSGTATQMAQIARTVHQAAKAAQPSITVLSPAFDTTAAMTAFLNASDGAAGFGRQWIEKLSYHPYSSALPVGLSAKDGVFLSNIDSNVRSALVSGGASANIDKIASEWSIAFALGDPRLLNPLAVAQFLARGSIWLASLGWKQSIPYAHGSALMSTIPSSQPAIKTLDNISNIAGTTMTSIQLQANAKWRVTANGVTVTI